MAHSLKGFAGVFQVQVLLELAQTAEQAVKNQDAEVLGMAKSLADCLLTVLQELQQFKEMNKPDES